MKLQRLLMSPDAHLSIATFAVVPKIFPITGTVQQLAHIAQQIPDTSDPSCDYENKGVKCSGGGNMRPENISAPENISPENMCPEIICPEEYPPRRLSASRENAPPEKIRPENMGLQR